MRVACIDTLDGGCHVRVGNRAPMSRHRGPPPSLNLKNRVSLEPVKHRALARRPSLIAYSNHPEAMTTIPRENRKTSDDEIVELYKDIGKMACSRRSQGLPIDREEQGMWEECRLCAMDDMEAATPFRISNILYRCRRGQYFDIDLFEALFRKAREDPEFMGKFHPIGVSMSIQSMGTMAKFAHLDGCQRALRFFENSGGTFVKDLMRVSVENGILKKRDFGTKELSNALHGVGLYARAARVLYDDFPAVESFARAVCSEFIVKGGLEIHPRDFSNLLHGCAKCRFTDKDYIEQIAAALEMRLSMGSIQLTSRDLSTIIWSLGKVKFSNVELMDKLSKLVMIQKMGQKGLAMVIYGCASIGYKNRPLLQYFGEKVSDPNELRQFNEQELASIVYSLFGFLRYSNTKALAALGSEIIKEKRLKKFSEQGLCTIVYGFRVARFKKLSFLQPLASEITQPHRLERLQNMAIAGLVLGFAMLDFPDTRFFDDLGEEAIKPHRLSKYPVETLTSMLFGFKWARHCKNEVLTALADEVIQEHRLQAFTSQSLANAVHSLGLLGLEDEAVWDALRGEVLREERLQEFSLDCLMKLVKGFGPVKGRYSEVLDVLGDQMSKKSKST